jgi:antitoxin VapB
MIVVCAKRNGLIASLSRIVCNGKIPDDLRKRTDACARVNARLLAATKPGAQGKQLFQIATDVYAAENFAGEEKLHHQGGAAGYKTRDWVANPNSTETVHENQAFAWNPSITGTKTEETIIVRGDETKIITMTPDFPQISVEIEGCEYLSPDVLSL